MLDRTAHPNTRTMLEAWRRMEAAPAPRSSDLQLIHEPSALLANIFVLREAAGGTWRFRTAGQALHDYFGKNVCDEDFFDLWMGGDRGLARSVADAITAEGSPGVIRARGETLTGRALQVEIALAPLSHRPGTARRLLGHYQPLGGEKLLERRPIWRHAITEIHAPQRRVRPARPHLHLVSSRD
ncbi:MAG: PAS domain-containing protein [Pseudomonadota bacterium]